MKVWALLFQVIWLIDCKVLETIKRPVRRTLSILTINSKHILNAEDYNIDQRYSVPEGVKFGLYL